jgi:hypothetical protein
MCTACGYDKSASPVIDTFETKSAEITGLAETLHCDLHATDRNVQHLVRVLLLVQVYTSIRVTGSFCASQTLLKFNVSGGAAVTSSGGWTETKPVTPYSSAKQDFNSVTIERTGNGVNNSQAIDILTKVEATDPWGNHQWYTADTVGFQVNAMP